MKAALIAWLRRRVLSREERALCAALRAPHRWRPETPLTAAEGAEWGKLLETTLGRKIDLAMWNWCAQQAQHALASPPEHLQQAAGFARGVRAGWEMAKTLSRLAGATAGDTETDEPTTAAAGLDHHRP